MSVVPCMGGWCRKREGCDHYHARSETLQPAERLCPPGQDNPERLGEFRRRFAAILASMTAEQQARFEAEMMR